MRQYHTGKLGLIKINDNPLRLNYKTFANKFFAFNLYIFQHVQPLKIKLVEGKNSLNISGSLN